MTARWNGYRWIAMGVLGALGLGGCAAANQPAPPPMAAMAAHKPDEQGLYLQLVERMEKERQWYAALAYLEEYHRHWPENAQTWYLRARALRATGQLKESEGYYQKLLDGPLSAYGYEGLGLVAAAQGQSGDALREFRKAARQAPTNADILNNLGYAALVAKDLPLAKDSLFKAGQLAPDDQRIWSNIALYYFAAGEPLRAQEVMDKRNMGWEESNAIRARAAALTGGASAHGVAQGTPTPFAKSSGPLLSPPIAQVFSGAAHIGVSR
jgi:Flp pilus assembly protein TadD